MANSHGAGTLQVLAAQVPTAANHCCLGRNPALFAPPPPSPTPLTRNSYVAARASRSVILQSSRVPSTAAVPLGHCFHASLPTTFFSLVKEGFVYCAVPLRRHLGDELLIPTEGQHAQPERLQVRVLAYHTPYRHLERHAAVPYHPGAAQPDRSLSSTSSSTPRQHPSLTRGQCGQRHDQRAVAHRCHTSGR